MKQAAIIILVVFAVTIVAPAQIVSFSGMVTDSLTGEPVENVNLKILGTDFGASTAENGYFSLDFPSLPARIRVSHIHYKSKTLEVANWKDVRRIQLSPHVYELSEAVVKPAVSISDGLWLDIIDYEHLGDSILLSGYCYHYDKERNPWIYLISPQGDTLIQQVAGAEGHFFTDCMGNTHYLTETSDFQIIIEKDSLMFVHPERLSDFEAYLKPCLFETPQELIFQQYIVNDQVIVYNAVNKKTHEWRPLGRVQDDIALNMLAFQDRFFAMGNEPTEADMRFEKMCFYDSIYAPVFYLNQQVCLFNFYDNEIVIMNDDFDIIRRMPVDAHHNKDFQEKLIPDYSRGEIYALFERSGFTYIRDISLRDGTVGDTWRIPDFKWVRKITVRDGILYFLYREKYTGDLVSLYRMKLKN
jgi:hypothetical protein